VVEPFETLEAKLRVRQAPTPQRTDECSGSARDALADRQPAPPERVLDVEMTERLARLYAAASESCERACRRVVQALAEDVLGRELRLAPAELDGLIRDAIDALRASEPITLILAAGANVAPCGVPVRIDPSLAPGDVRFEVRDGVVDLRLTVRFEYALEEAG